MTVVDPVAEGLTVDGVRRLCDDNLALARKILDGIKVLADGSAPLTWGNTFEAFDNAFLAVSNGSEFPYLMGVAHPDEAVRKAARDCEGKTESLVTSIYLDAALAKVLQRHGADTKGLEGERARFVSHTLRSFRRNGIALAPEKQTRLREINRQITEIGQGFIAEISSSRGTISITPTQLTGLPKSYKAAHPANAEGKVVISTDYPDYYPFVKYALDRRAATKLYSKFVNRGGPANVERLGRLLALRYEKAQMLGYASWADYAIEPRMAKDAADVAAFLKRVGAAIKPAAERELKEFRAEHRRLAIKAGKTLLPPDRYFLTERLKEKRFKFDSKELAKYFEVNAVTKGLLATTAKMYGIEFRPITETTWHRAVTGYEIWGSGRLIGKFYLDLQARPDKYKHAAMFSVRTAKTLANGARQTPVAALVCNFPAPGEPMGHDQVLTYFHEFGHVLHHLLTNTQLASFAGTNTVRDFVEAPSQMFEEWAWSREVLDGFARHNQTGEKLPDKLWQAMNRSRRFGVALSTQRQLFLATLDLAYHTAKPPLDTTKLLERIHGETFSFGYVPGTHFQSSFGHLIGYDAGYYGYQWALALAHDALSRFKKEGLFNTATADDWRQKVLSRGGGADERAMFRSFLGREPSEDAYAAFLSGK